GKGKIFAQAGVFFRRYRRVKYLLHGGHFQQIFYLFHSRKKRGQSLVVIFW
ncbi:hypothetical protein SAMN02745218_02928, partial [Desulfofundulus australicus DSM 11792]